MADQNNPGQFGNRADTDEQASKGGKSQGKESNPGNFANDREKAIEAGRKGGQSRGQSDMDATDEMDEE
ncbi:MAG: KGG domain-containing protein [Candidatus Pacebacteria bacterium]|nr:KGG domain-containing protein [Candidatus Paceibacterota bacterium]